MWIVFALASSVVSSLQNVYYKKVKSQVNPLIMAWSVLVVSAILYTPLFLFGIPHLTKAFWIAVAIRLVLDSLAFSLFINGIQKTKVSLVAPMTALVPLFSIIPVYLINHLFPSLLGFSGILLTIVGLYFLHFDHDTKHILSPFKAVLQNKHVFFVTISAALWSIIIGLNKLAIDNSSPYFYTAFFQVVWALFFTPIAFVSNPKLFLKIIKPSEFVKFTPAGMFDSVQVFAQNIAVSLANPTYVNIVGKTDILLSSFFAFIFLKEKIGKHIIPTLIIIAGVILVTFAQK